MARASAAGLLVLGGVLTMFGLSSSKTRTLDDVATVSLPSRWRARETMRDKQWAAFEFVRTQAWWWGAGDPLEVRAWVVIAAADAPDTVLEAGMMRAFSTLQESSQRFSEFGSWRDGPRETWTSDGTYRLHPRHDPKRVIFLRSIDRTQKAAFVARVYEHKIPHQQLQRLTREVYGSLRLTNKRTSYFREVSDWAGVSAARRKNEIAYINRFLAERGLPPAKEDAIVHHNGWVYQLFPDMLAIGRILGSRRLKTPAYGARGELAWLRYDHGEWQRWTASNRAKPPRGEPYYASSDVPQAWAEVLGPDVDKSQAHFFTVRWCELTGDRWEEERDPASWDLPGWFDNALRVERAFQAGSLVIE